MPSTPITDAMRRAVLDLTNLHYWFSPYGPAWRACQGLNGLYAGTPICAQVTTTSGSPTLSIVSGALGVAWQIAGPGIPIGASIVSVSGSSAQMSANATAGNSAIAITLIRPRDGNLWMNCLAVNMDYALWKYLGDTAAKQRILDMSNFLFSDGGYSQAEMNSDGFSDGSMNLLDDVGVKARMLEQIYDVSGDSRYLTALKCMIPASLRRFQGANRTTSDLVTMAPSNVVKIVKDDGTIAKDPSDANLDFFYWNHGASYSPDADAHKNQGHINNPYEANIALSALSIYDRYSGSDAYYHYAYATYFRMKEDYTPKAVKPNGDPRPENAYGCGNFYANYDFSLRTSDQWYFGYPKVGASSLDVNLSLTLALLAARLYNLPRTTAADKSTLLQDINNIVASIQKPQTQFGLVTTYDSANPKYSVPVSGIFLSWADSWTDTNNLAAFTKEVLAIPNVDTGNTCAKIIAKTGAYALLTRKVSSFYTNHGAAYLNPETSGTYVYTADWGGQLPAPVDYNGLLSGYTGYEPQQAANPGSTEDSWAGSQQVMTNVQATVAAIAAAIVEQTGITLPNYNIPVPTLIDDTTGATLVDGSPSSTLLDA